MTSEITWTGSLNDIDKIKELSGFIKKLGDMVHQVFFAEDKDKITVKQYNGLYSGNIALSNSILNTTTNFELTNKQLAVNRKKYRFLLEKHCSDNGLKISKEDFLLEVDKFFEHKILINKVELMGVSFKYPTEMGDKREDINYMSSISFVFIIGAYIGNTKLEAATGKMCGVYERDNLLNSYSIHYRPLDYSIHEAGVLVRHFPLTELYDLLHWVKRVYVNDLLVNNWNDFFEKRYSSIMYYAENNWINREGFFNIAKEKIKENCISLRAMDDVILSDKYDDNNWDEINKEIEEKLKKEYKDL